MIFENSWNCIYTEVMYNTNFINSLITLLVKTFIDSVINLAGSPLPDFAEN